MPVFTNAGQEEINTTSCLDSFLVCVTFGLRAGSVAIEYVDVGRVDVDMREEVLPHKGVVGVGVVSRKTDILVHVEGDYILERDLLWLDDALG